MARKSTGKAEGSRFTVYRDTGEKLGWTFSPTTRCAGTVDKNLYTGDYSLEGCYENKVFVIERKGSVAELAGNLTNAEKWDDFRQELERLEEFRWPFLLCEFSQRQLEMFPHGSGIPKSRWRQVRFRGPYLLRRVSEVSLQYKTKIFFSDSPEGAKSLALSLFKRVAEACPPATN